VGDLVDTLYLPLRGRGVGIPKGTPPRAGTSYHGSYAGGLLEHSLNVYDHLKRLMTAYLEIEVDQEPAVIADGILQMQDKMVKTWRADV